MQEQCLSPQSMAEKVSQHPTVAAVQLPINGFPHICIEAWLFVQNDTHTPICVCMCVCSKSPSPLFLCFAFPTFSLSSISWNSDLVRLLCCVGLMRGSCKPRFFVTVGFGSCLWLLFQLGSKALLGMLTWARTCGVLENCVFASPVDLHRAIFLYDT